MADSVTVIGNLTRVVASARNEADFQGCVIDLFREFGWRVSHNQPARTARGRMITTGDPGFPDLTCLRPPDLLFLELKHVGAWTNPEVREQQYVWINGLQAAGQHAWIVNEGAWPLLVAMARDGIEAGLASLTEGEQDG